MYEISYLTIRYHPLLSYALRSDTSAAAASGRGRLLYPLLSVLSVTIRYLSRDSKQALLPPKARPRQHPDPILEIAPFLLQPVLKLRLFDAALQERQREEQLAWGQGAGYLSLPGVTYRYLSLLGAGSGSEKSSLPGGRAQP